MTKADFAGLEKTIETASRNATAISEKTRGEVREAVETALDLLDEGKARVAERDERKLDRQPMAEEGGPAVLPAEPDGSHQGRAGRLVLVGQGAVEIRQAGARRSSRRPAFAPCRRRSCGAPPMSPRAPS